MWLNKKNNISSEMSGSRRWKYLGKVENSTNFTSVNFTGVHDQSQMVSLKEMS